MTQVVYQKIPADVVGQRLDNYLMARLKGVPKSHIYRIIRAGEVRLNKKRAMASAKLQLGDVIRIPPVRHAEAAPVFVGDSLATRLREAILFEDEALMVLNKPAGIAVHGGSGLQLGVIEALRVTRSDVPYLELVHRLDKETSGCLMLAKKRHMLRSIHALLEARMVQKTYVALLTGIWQGPKQQVVSAPLHKITLASGGRMVSVQPQGKSAETVFTLITQYSSGCLVEAQPKTGRTHQIRVHSAYLGHPIVGDEKYGAAHDVGGLFLHAKMIRFMEEGLARVFVAPLDQRFNARLRLWQQVV